jgi:glutamyl-tRNA synthetase
MPALDHDLIVKIAHDYAAVCEKSEAQDANAWFEEIKSLCPAYGLASDMKAYKQDPDAYKGNVGDFSMVLRVAVCGRSQAPDLFQVMQLLGKERVIERLGQVK